MAVLSSAPVNDIATGVLSTRLPQFPLLLPAARSFPHCRRDRLPDSERTTVTAWETLLGDA